MNRIKKSLFVVSRMQTLGTLCDLHVELLVVLLPLKRFLIFYLFVEDDSFDPLDLSSKKSHKKSINYWSFGEISFSNGAKPETLVNEDPLHNPRLFFRNCRNVTLLGRSSSVPQGQLRFQGGGRFWWSEVEGCGKMICCLGKSWEKNHGLFCWNFLDWICKNSNAKGDSKMICFFSLHTHGRWFGIGDLSANWPKR